MRFNVYHYNIYRNMHSILDTLCGACIFLTAEIAVHNGFVLLTLHWSSGVTGVGRGPSSALGDGGHC